MKTTEEYLDDYLDKYNELKKKNELWRIRVTPEKFLSEIERITAYGIEQRRCSYLTEYHIQRNQEAMISVLLMDAMTYEEMKGQFDRLAEARELEFAADAPNVQQQLKNIQTPLNFNEVLKIYRWLFRKQITIDMLSTEVFEKFRNTRQYKALIRKKIIDDWI